MAKTVTLPGELISVRTTIIKKEEYLFFSPSSQAPVVITRNIKKDKRDCAVILTATPTEYKAVREHLDESTLEWPQPDETRVHEQMQFHPNGKSWDVVIIRTGKGNIKAAIETLIALQYYEPQIMLFVGTAGAADEELCKGDVVVGEKVYSYEYVKNETTQKSGRKAHKSHAIPELIEADPYLKNLASILLTYDTWQRRIKETKAKGKGSNNGALEPKVFPGALATGGQVIASTLAKAYKIIKDSYYDTLAVEMEGYGFSVAAKENKKVHAIVIRGVSDIIEDENKNDTDRQGWRERAMKHASAFAFELIANFERS